MLFYFSSTGNSRYTAQRIAATLGVQLLSMNDRIKAGDTSPVKTDGRLVIVTPTYAWRIPCLVENWLHRTEFLGGKQVWFVMTCGSEIGNAAKYNRAICREKQLVYMGTAQIVMPENYIAMFNAPQAEEARQIIAKAEPVIDRAISAMWRVPKKHMNMKHLEPVFTTSNDRLAGKSFAHPTFSVMNTGS